MTMIDDHLDAMLARAAGMAFSIPDAAAERQDFLAAFADAGRRFRPCLIHLDQAELSALTEAGLMSPQDLSAADLARLRMLRAALAKEETASLIGFLYRTGDNAEREAVLKSLMLLPAPDRFLDIAVDAVRAAVVTTVAAIACGNAYPAAYFPQPAFRAMVLKALHLGLPLARIAGLSARHDAELARMGAAYASEQRAAGRAVSSDLSLLLEESAPCA